MKRLATKDDAFVIVEHPVSENQLEERKNDYELLSPREFNRKHGISFSESVQLTMDGENHDIQVNACDAPFCAWFGLPQQQFEDIKYKPRRYSLTGAGDPTGQPRIRCNEISGHPGNVLTGSPTLLYSNWSLAEEIARLARNDKVFDVEPDYQFHREDCIASETTPFEHRDGFRKKGRHHTSNSQRWQCRHCGKYTNVLPERRESWTYHQQRNEIVPRFAHALVNKSSVRRTMEMLNIGAQTYYNKVDLLYKRCVTFLERHEREVFRTKSFPEMWMATDQMIYHLNNVRKKGQGGKYYDNLEDLQLVTHILVSAEVSSRYVFRADIAYDPDVTPSQIQAQTLKYKDDHLAAYARKNDRLRFAYAPQPPTAEDTQSEELYSKEQRDFNLRKKYVDGMHVMSAYTAMAHYWHIRNMIRANEWRFVSDDDHSLATALYRVFADEIRRAKAHHFLCLIDRNKTRSKAFQEYAESRRFLRAFAEANGYDGVPLYTVAHLKLLTDLHYHDFYSYKNGHPIHAGRPIQHPYPAKDTGYREVDCKTNLSGHDPRDLADLLMKVDDRASNEFMQQIRRRLSTLERPLVTSRAKDGKSYIYANFNPRYAQQSLTILRTYYNFCVPWKRKRNITPAQRLGIADRQYTMEDIIYGE